MIFIVGNSRSGTTLLGRMLDNHSNVRTFEELHFFEQMVDSKTIRERPNWPLDKRRQVIERLLTSADDNVFAKVKPGHFTAEAEEILNETRAPDIVSAYATMLDRITRRSGKTVPCEQTPRYLYVAEEILEAFPDAVMVCMVRDPRAVLASQKNKWRRYRIARDRMPLFWALRAWVNYHPKTMALMWASASRRARQLQKHPRAIVIQYEKLLSDPRSQLKAICELAGIEFEEEMIQVALIGSSTAVDKPDQLGVDASRVDAWRNGSLTPSELAICEATTAKEMAYWGYTPVARPMTAPVRVFHTVGFMVKSGTALLLNVRRFKNLRETIKRRLA
ncbi:sulfotransferase family protein [Martelella mediterranea]|uniref:Sulfotransferase domain protein n=1 Tax=Martelella mediterranea DSM 17316 TaxID=1122214 RepID=A0A1U9Z012_9HYPH|nr:sulfotransferase [Martelella mediterranea]AQZ51037.1 Sulfotransferase domain protein [Martelella mediterranea DSM 17316]